MLLDSEFLLPTYNATREPACSATPAGAYSFLFTRSLDLPYEQVYSTQQVSMLRARRIEGGA
jgi:hypothetical protein